MILHNSDPDWKEFKWASSFFLSYLVFSHGSHGVINLTNRMHITKDFPKSELYGVKVTSHTSRQCSVRSMISSHLKNRPETSKDDVSWDSTMFREKTERVKGVEQCFWYCSHYWTDRIAFSSKDGSKGPSLPRIPKFGLDCRALVATISDGFF